MIANAHRSELIDIKFELHSLALIKGHMATGAIFKVGIGGRQSSFRMFGAVVTANALGAKLYIVGALEAMRIMTGRTIHTLRLLKAL